MDVHSNRAARKWTRRENLGRVLWALAHPLFAWSPRPFWAWRRTLLRLFRARIGRNVHVYPSVRIAIPWNLSIDEGSAVGDRAILYALGPITLGRATTVSQNSHLCAGSHDYSRADRPLTKPPITIGDSVWICADAFVGPDVSIGDGAIVGARAVVVRNVSAKTMVAGNPAREIKHLD
ncbi:MAG: acetyltransferase [Pseudomonadota bacterium]